jgi:hypothetical protein
LDAAQRELDNARAALRERSAQWEQQEAQLLESKAYLQKKTRGARRPVVRACVCEAT